ncbi:MAG: 6-carboxytetrahydropterin synthase [Mucilaginibacter sp.]
MMIYATQRACFSAAHRMYREEWSAEKNNEVFGKCANPNWHGHNYKLFITIKGAPTCDNGCLIDLNSLKSIIDQHIMAKLDHHNLNLDVDFMKGKMATTEIICMEIFKQLKDPIECYEGVFLHSVRLHETENNAVEYFGD